MQVLSILAAALCILPAQSPLHERLAAAPAQPLHVEQGLHEISTPLILNEDNGGLYGHGVIIQTDPSQPIIRIENAANIRIEGVTLTRPEGAQDSTESAIRAEHAAGLVLDGIRILHNHSQSAAIRLDACDRATIRDCEILNYKTIGIDDRTTSPLYGYAFRCIDGAGILVDSSTHTAIINNRVVEERLLPTKEMKEQHKLGSLTDGRQPLNPGELARGVAERGYVDNWHQGSAIVVTSPEKTRHTTIQGNHIINAAQAIDMHCDYANVTGNIIDRCMIGIKGTHGCFGLVIANNTITRADLWGMVFNPGAASHGTEPAEEGGPPRPLNNDAGILIANNIIADYGHGNEYWNWGGREPDAPSSYGIAFFKGQLDTNPPMTEVLVQGNMILSGGPATAASPSPAPRYRHAIYLEGWDQSTRHHNTAILAPTFSNNVLQPGLMGVSNAAVE